MYIYQQDNWPHFTYNNEILLTLLSEVRNLQGKIIGKMETLGFNLKNEAVLEIMTLDILKSTEIEGEILEPEQVRSSLARRLGMNVSNPVHVDRDVDGVVEMMLDATQNYDKPMSSERLFNWHRSLFSTGKSGMHNIIVGNGRNDSSGKMQVVSGAMGKEKIHYQAPNANLLEKEMRLFIDWCNNENTLDPVIKAGIAHLWFVTLHPFEDGNGRIARAISDMQLSKADKISQRYYSMSAQIRIERKEYYNILEKSQKGTLNITIWLQWFLSCLLKAINASDEILLKVLNKHQFWIAHSKTVLNERQILILNKLLDGFTGKLSTSKWAKIAKCSDDTALRDIRDLLSKQILYKETAGGRSTSYKLADIEKR
ncbi:MAG: Fic family protein [Spirochaetia bacterium]|nr:Fic family protein [Spirochaetia bacterium]